MLEIDFNDVLAILKTCAPYLIALGVVVVLAIAAMVVCRKMSRSKKFLVRTQSVVAMLLALVVVVNLICFGPMSTIIGLATGNGTVTEDTAAEAAAIAENIAGEGIVLLKNDDLLPLSGTKNLNLFGWASVNPVYGGSGSGSINDLWPIVSLEEGLTNAGFSLNTELSKFYSSYTADRPTMSISKQAWTLPEPPADTYSDELISNAKAFSDVAVVVISRMGGEGYADMPKDLSGGAYDSNSDQYDDFPAGAHYLELSQTERNMVELVCNNFDNVILVYNSAHAFELGFVDEFPQIKSALWCPGTGNVGFNALGKILTGEVNPSAKTADTFAYDLTKAPWWNNSDQLRYANMEDKALELHQGTYSFKLYPSFTNYSEGIYVGYKYYETAAAENLIDYDKAVQYPFGYGLSYTGFTQKMGPISENNGAISFDVTVTNTGSVAGKDVVEVYYNPPYANGGIEKSAANLVAFDKTELLAPGASETISISFQAEDMASYDMSGNGRYVLEKGDYGISIRSDSHTVIDEQTYTMASNVVYDESNPRSTDDAAASNKFDAEGDVTFLSRKDGFANFAEATAAPKSTDASQAFVDGFTNNSNFDPSVYYDANATMPTTGAKNGMKLSELRGADYDDPRWDTLLDQLTPKEMNTLIAMAGFQTSAISSVEKVSTIDCDGPASINNNFTGTGSIGFPVAVMIASTWSQDLATAFGESIGKMANEMNVTGWYAPAMNTHRTPFGGRNFEYYSEDGVLGGKIASGAVSGAQSRGVYAYIKHFGLYDSNAMMVSIWSNEQAIRENYFKPFELSVKEGGANAMMVAWSFFGHTWSGATGVLNTILRDEWGFRGFVLTDSFGGDGRGFMNADLGLNNGVDAMLATYDAGPNFMVDTTQASSVIALRQASKNIMYTVVNSHAYDAANVQTGMLSWQIAAIAIDVVLAAAFIAFELLVIRKGYAKRKTDELSAPTSENTKQ